MDSTMPLMESPISLKSTIGIWKYSVENRTSKLILFLSIYASFLSFLFNSFSSGSDSDGDSPLSIWPAINRGHNEILMAAVSLLDSSDFEDAVNYGRVSWLVAHEFSHLFTPLVMMIVLKLKIPNINNKF